MRTLVAGLRVVRRAPKALLPFSIAGVVGALVVGSGGFPATGASAPATAAFPLDLFFDLKQAVAFAPGWEWFAGVILVTVMVRGALLAGTLWLAEGSPGPFVGAWVSGIRVAATGVAWLLPSAVLFFVGVAVRYAPFIWMAAAAGLFPAALLARRAARMDAGNGVPDGRGVPEVPGFLGYALAVTVFAAAMSVLGRAGAWAAAIVPLTLGPVHALFLLGWREHLKQRTYPGGGAIAVVLVGAAVLGLAATTVYDRYISDLGPVARAPARGVLVGVGGADSTSETGALVTVDPRDLGFARGRTRLLSYRGGSETYGASDTRGDLEAIAVVIGAQVEDLESPRAWLGHSQAALILDRILAAGLAAPDAAVSLAPSPPRPPFLVVPPPGRSGTGRVGGDLGRAFSGLLDAIGLTPFDLDAPASPSNLEPVVVDDAALPRLAIWALGDSVWLDEDWRRPGEINVVALTDHVGVANDARALELARDFYAGEDVADDDSSWRGGLVSFYRYLFEPWRPR